MVGIIRKLGIDTSKLVTRKLYDKNRSGSVSNVSSNNSRGGPVRSYEEISGPAAAGNMYDHRSHPMQASPQHAAYQHPPDGHGAYNTGGANKRGRYDGGSGGSTMPVMSGQSMLDLLNMGHKGILV